VNSDSYRPHALEDALTELDLVQRAGVFERTSLPGASSEPRTPRRRKVRVAVPLALAAMITLVVWTGFFYWQIQSIRSQNADSASGVIRLATGPGAAFADCLTGPGEVVTSPCRLHDYDADGDVDLADYGRRQVGDAQTASISR